MSALDQYREHFSMNGYVMVSGLLAPQDLAAIEGNLARYIRDVVPRLPDDDLVFENEGQPESLKLLIRMNDHDSFFEQMQQWPRIREAADALLGRHAVPRGVIYYTKPPRIGKPTPPHQDAWTFCISPPEALTLWFPLDPANEHNGALRFVPGSQATGVRPHHASGVRGFTVGITDWSSEDEAKEVVTTSSPGDMLAYHCGTIHRAGPNQSVHPRRGIAIVLYAKEARADAAAQQRYRQSLRQA
jgi:phytanoyl-CoA hydroxylase